MDKKRIIKEKLNFSMDYKSFKEYSENVVEKLKEEKLSDEAKDLLEYRKLNLARVNRVEKSYFPSEKMKSIVSKFNKQTWLVITEDWCGDSAQNLPAIAKIAELNPNISLKIVLRDSNLDLMDLYLTDGKRSIPKLIALDDALNEIFMWGPRPHKAQEHFDALKNEGFDKGEIIKEIHSWYAKDKCQALEEDFEKLLSNVDVKKY